MRQKYLILLLLRKVCRSVIRIGSHIDDFRDRNAPSMDYRRVLQRSRAHNLKDPVYNVTISYDRGRPVTQL